jgi:hypothetical protein
VYNWYTVQAKPNAYAANKNAEGAPILLHRFLLKTDLQIDHIDGNGLHNWKGNLRPSTQQQNLWNQRINSRNTSGFKGVCRNGKNWRAAIWLNRKRMHLGTFLTREEAHAAYCEAAKQLFGEFANDGVITLRPQSPGESPQVD